MRGIPFSLAIELNQLLNNRITDIDDLFTNTLGAIVGYVLYKVLYTALFKLILKREEKEFDTNSPLVIKYEAVLFSVFICRCNVNLSSSFIWKTCNHPVR